MFGFLAFLAFGQDFSWGGGAGAGVSDPGVSDPVVSDPGVSDPGVSDPGMPGLRLLALLSHPKKNLTQKPKKPKKPKKSTKMP